MQTYDVTALPRPISWWGGGLTAPSPRTSPPALAPSGLELRPFRPHFYESQSLTHYTAGNPIFNQNNKNTSRYNVTNNVKKNQVQKHRDHVLFHIVKLLQYCHLFCGNKCMKQ